MFGLSRILGGEERPYDMSATTQCLRARALSLTPVPRGERAFLYPGLEGRFKTTPAHEFVDFEMYFAPSVSAAKDLEQGDSERVPRRANVLFTAADLSDPRLTGCLQRRDQGDGR